MSRVTLPSANDDSTLLRAVEIIRRRKTIAVMVFATVLVAAVSVALSLPNLFRATATVLVERPVAESFVRQSVTGELEGRLHVITQENLSRQRLTDLIERFNLYPKQRQRGDISGVFDQMRRDIQVELSGPERVTSRGKTVAFNLSYTGEDRTNVADVVNEIATFYISRNDAIRSQEAVDTSQFLKTELDEARKQLNQQDARLREYTFTHVGELPQQVGLNLASLERLNTQLRLNSEQQIRTLEQRQRLTETMPSDGSLVGGSSAEMNPDDRIVAMKRDLAQLEARYNSKYPDVVRLKQEIAALEAAAQDKAPSASTEDVLVASRAQGLATVRANLDKELERLRLEQESLRQAIDDFEHRLESVPERQQDLALITRDHQAAQERYHALLTRAGEASVAESIEIDRSGERFRVLEPAVPPADPSAPNRLRLLILGVILALGASVIGVLIVEQFDTSFHSADDVREFTRVPVLASISRMPAAPARRWLGATFATISFVAVLVVVAMLSTQMARGNEQLVRILVHG
jgi:polysaccharide chain length determinant protein (PEP-CTERM system associated)